MRTSLLFNEKTEYGTQHVKCIRVRSDPTGAWADLITREKSDSSRLWFLSVYFVLKTLGNAIL